MRLSGDYFSDVKSISTALRISESFDLIERHLEVADKELCFYYIDGFVKYPLLVHGFEFPTNPLLGPGIQYSTVNLVAIL